MHIGEAEVAPLAAVGEALVVDAELVEDGGVEIVKARVVPFADGRCMLTR